MASDNGTLRRIPLYGEVTCRPGSSFETFIHRHSGRVSTFSKWEQVSHIAPLITVDLGWSRYY